MFLWSIISSRKCFVVFLDRYKSKTFWNGRLNVKCFCNWCTPFLVDFSKPCTMHGFVWENPENLRLKTQLKWKQACSFVSRGVEWVFCSKEFGCLCLVYFACMLSNNSSRCKELTNCSRKGKVNLNEESHCVKIGRLLPAPEMWYLVNCDL